MFFNVNIVYLIKEETKMSKESAKKFEKDLQSNLSLKNKFEDMLNSASNLSKDEKAKKNN